MIRTDIQVIPQQETIIIQSDKHFFSFARNGTGAIEAFCTMELTPEMTEDITRSGIVSIQSCVNGSLILSPEFGYDTSKMQKVIIGLFEKFNL